jgi:DNA sulfur modification protein DndB
MKMEVKLFDTINTKAKGIGPSLSKFLRRDSDDISWVATELMVRKESPFYSIGSIIGKRSRGRHVTLQNVYRTLHHLTADYRISSLSKEEKLAVAMTYYDTIRQTFSSEWLDYKGFRLTHIVCLDALSLAGNHVILKCMPEGKKHVDLTAIQRHVKRLSLDLALERLLQT